MAREISIRKGPEFEFIIPEHRQAFEQKVIICYEKALSEKNLSRYKVPHVDVDLFDYIQLADPIHYVAARLSDKDENEHFYDDHLKHLSYEEQFRMAVDFMKEFEDDKDFRPRLEYDELFYQDIAAVLNFHHMSFVDVGKISDFGSYWIPGEFYKNLPWGKQVW